MASQPDRIKQLADEISKSSKIITEYLASKKLPSPSFDEDGLDELQISPADTEAYTTRSRLVAATKELHDLAVGPKESLRHLAWDVSYYFSIETNQCSGLHPHSL